MSHPPKQQFYQAKLKEKSILKRRRLESCSIRISSYPCPLSLWMALAPRRVAVHIYPRSIPSHQQAGLCIWLPQIKTYDQLLFDYWSAAARRAPFFCYRFHSSLTASSPPHVCFRFSAPRFWEFCMCRNERTTWNSVLWIWQRSIRFFFICLFLCEKHRIFVYK